MELVVLTRTYLSFYLGSSIILFQLASSLLFWSNQCLFTGMETDKWEGKRSINEAEEEDEEDEHESVEEDSNRKRVLTLSGRKLSGGGSAHPSCQVEQCPADMTDAKPYHRRHKVCEFHSKSPIVLIGGLQQRFCQQCSRFHLLEEFDEAKRSCRRRLAGHNERRRKLHMSLMEKA